MDPIAAEINSVSAVFDSLLRQQRAARAQAVKEAAGRIEEHLGEWTAQLRGQLKQQLDKWDRFGVPISFLRVAGQNHLEKPLNRLLAWWADPSQEHGFGAAFLHKLAELIHLPDMVDDIAEQGDKPEIRAEQSVDGDTLGKEPDLMVRTAHAAFLLENKLWAPESGDQYGPYHEVLERWAGSSRSVRAVLCARERRATPSGWDFSIAHADLAAILEGLSSRRDFPVWGKIAAVQSALVFRGGDISDLIRTARQVYQESAKGEVSPERISRLREVLPLPEPPAPWEICDG